MIRNVVLDMGNVMLDYNPERYLETYIEREEDRPLVKAELFGAVEWTMCDYGTGDDEGLIAAACRHLPERLHPQVEKLVRSWYYDMPAYPEMGEKIGELLDKGYRLYVLSNVNRHYDVMRRSIPHLDRFSGEFVSYQWKLIKPEPAIFSAFCQHFNLVPAECLFVDDRQDNVLGAMRVGMNAMVYHGDPARIDEKLEELK